MDSSKAMSAFAALSQQTRLDVYRLLIKAGSGGLVAGQISEQLQVLQNTLSTNLNILVGAGLVRRAREGRSVRYFADFTGTRELLGFLLEDCCGGSPEFCEPFVARITRCC